MHRTGRVKFPSSKNISTPGSRSTKQQTNVLSNFSWRSMPHRGLGSFSNLWCSDHIRKCICKSKKLKVDIFNHAPRQNSPPGSYHYFPLLSYKRKLLTHPPPPPPLHEAAIFWKPIPHQKKLEGTMMYNNTAWIWIYQKEIYSRCNINKCYLSINHSLVLIWEEVNKKLLY